MWDADLVSRVRDRKLNEIMIFASMAKIDSQNIDGYIDIIVSLGDDIDACDTLLDTDGETEIALETIDAPEYLDRLSPGERSDEDAFNAMKVSPYCEEAVPEDIEDYVRQLISDAVESLKGDDGSRDALDALKEELAMVRNRNEELSKDLDFRMTENASLSDELKTVQSERDELQAQVDSLKAKVREMESSLSQLDAMSEDLSKANEQVAVLTGEVARLQDELSMRDSEIAAVETEMDAAVEENTELSSEVEALKEEIAEAETEEIAEEILEEAESEESVAAEESPEPEPQVAEEAEVSAEEPVVSEESSDVPEPVPEVPEEASAQSVPVQEGAPAVDRILTDAQRDIVEAAKRMKDSKMDEFIDLSLAGKVDENVCDNIISFLKVDVSICDALLAMDYTDMDSILEGFRTILSIIDDAPEPHSQSVYTNSLTPEQSVVEYGYNKVIEHIQDVMLRRYANLL